MFGETIYLGVVVVVVAHVTTGGEAGVSAKAASRGQPSVVDIVSLRPLASLAQEPDEGHLTICNMAEAGRIGWPLTGATID